MKQSEKAAKKEALAEKVADTLRHFRGLGPDCGCEICTQYDVDLKKALEALTKLASLCMLLVLIGCGGRVASEPCETIQYSYCLTGQIVHVKVDECGPTTTQTRACADCDFEEGTAQCLDQK